MANTEFLITKFLQFQNQIRLYHWITNSYSKHKAYGKTYDKLDELIDLFVETYFGLNDKVFDYNSLQFSIETDDSFTRLESNLNTFTDFLSGFSDAFPTNTDLLNIRDEILGTVNHLKYLLTLQ